MSPRVCPICETVFLGSRRQKYCSDDCRKRARQLQERDSSRRARQKRRQQRQQMPQKPTRTVEDVFVYIERVYRETGVYLSYGKAVVRMETGRKDD